MKLNLATRGIILAAAITGSINAVGFRSPSLNGSTGLIGTPTARTGWENTDLGLDLGYHHASGNESSGLPKVNLALFNRFEIGGTIDTHEDPWENDTIFHGKFRFFPWSGSGSSALAVGFNHQSIGGLSNGNGGGGFSATQVYLATTYGGSIFGTDAETTIVLGKTFGDDLREDDIDFSMGFDANLAPSVFQGYLHWITDFGNYSYSLGSFKTNAANATYRGVLNTGARIAALKDHGRFKLNFDVLMLDAFDGNRGFGAGVIFGLTF